SVKVKATSESRDSAVPGLMSISPFLRVVAKTRGRACRTSAPILGVAALFQPIDVLAVLEFRDGDVRHCGRRRRSMPMLEPRRDPEDIARPDFLDWPALGLGPARPRGDDQGLAQRMRVPRAARAR